MSHQPGLRLCPLPLRNVVCMGRAAFALLAHPGCDENLAARWGRWMFMGVGVVSDKFMEAIEQITSKTYTKKVKVEGGGFEMVEFKVGGVYATHL